MKLSNDAVEALAGVLASHGATVADAAEVERTGSRMTDPTEAELRDYMVGAILAQITDPDYEGAAEAARERRADEANTGQYDDTPYVHGEGFVVLQNNVGDDDADFASYAAAVAYVDSVADALEAEGWNTDRSWASRDNNYAVNATRGDRRRTVEIVRSDNA